MKKECYYGEFQIVTFDTWIKTQCSYDKGDYSSTVLVLCEMERSRQNNGADEWNWNAKNAE